MHPGYVIYLVTRTCYYSKSGAGTSHWLDAKVFSEEEALKFCARHKMYDGNPGAVPVSLLHLEGLK